VRKYIIVEINAEYIVTKPSTNLKVGDDVLKQSRQCIAVFLLCRDIHHLKTETTTNWDRTTGLIKFCLNILLCKHFDHIA